MTIEWREGGPKPTHRLAPAVRQDTKNRQWRPKGKKKEDDMRAELEEELCGRRKKRRREEKEEEGENREEVGGPYWPQASVMWPLFGKGKWKDATVKYFSLLFLFLWST